MNPIEFVVDVEHAAKRSLSAGQHFYFTRRFVEFDDLFCEEAEETLGPGRMAGIRKEISVALGIEFLRSGLFPLSKYFAPIEGLHG